jgi:hypothetical protein
MDQERAAARALRAEGLSNRTIGKRLSLSTSSVAALLRWPVRFAPRTCWLCGTVFTPTNGRQRFCCRAHWAQYRARQRDGLPARECRLCGASFKPNSAAQRYCCAEHREQHHRPALTARQCRYCGDWFMPVSGGQRYCIAEHRRLDSPRTLAQARDHVAALEAELASVREQLGRAA